MHTSTVVPRKTLLQRRETLQSRTKVAEALAEIAARVTKRCPNDAIVQAVGYGPSMTVPALIQRLQAICRADPATQVDNDI